jgi:hypothetical protein
MTQMITDWHKEDVVEHDISIRSGTRIRSLIHRPHSLTGPDHSLPHWLSDKQTLVFPITPREDFVPHSTIKR